MKDFTLGKVIALITVFMFVLGLATWMVHAEDSHRDTDQLLEAVEGLVKLREADVAREQERKKFVQYLAAACKAGTYINKEECKKVGVELAD